MSRAIRALVQGGYSVRASCQAFGLPRSQYHRNVAAPEPTETDAALRENIQQVALDCSCYGYRRVTKELHRRGVRANHKRVLRLMREDNLLCLRKKRFIATTDSDHGLPVLPEPGGADGPDRARPALGVRPDLHPPGPRVRLPRGRTGWATRSSTSRSYWMRARAAAWAGRWAAASMQSWQPPLCGWR